MYSNNHLIYNHHTMIPLTISTTNIKILFLYSLPAFLPSFSFFFYDTNLFIFQHPKIPLLSFYIIIISSQSSSCVITKFLFTNHSDLSLFLFENLIILMIYYIIVFFCFCVVTKEMKMGKLIPFWSPSKVFMAF